MLETLAHFNFPTHRVHVTRDTFTESIHCFKYTPSRCDFDVFDDQESASEYILEPMPSVVYSVCVKNHLGEPETE